MTPSERLRHHARMALLDDGRIDLTELHHLVETAMEDRVIDEGERAVLKQVLDGIIVTGGEGDLKLMELVHRLKLVLKL